MTYGPISQCTVCARFRPNFEDGPTCAAFPKGIPLKIYDNTLDHRKPIEGDHGLQWVSNGMPYPDTGKTS